jgi:hypothetical protein
LELYFLSAPHLVSFFFSPPFETFPTHQPTAPH